MPAHILWVILTQTHNMYDCLGTLIKWIRPHGSRICASELITDGAANEVTSLPRILALKALIKCMFSPLEGNVGDRR